MLSATHHVSYWIISAAAAAIYHCLVSVLECPSDLFEVFLIPLGAYAVHVLWAGHGPKARPAVHIAATGCLVLSLGAAASSLHMPGVDVTQIRGGIHALLAFSVLGALEHKRQDRDDIESCFFPGFCTFPRLRQDTSANFWRRTAQYAYAWSFSAGVMAGLLNLVCLGLNWAYGLDMSWWSIWRGYLRNLPDDFASAFMLLRWFPDWIPKSKQELNPQERRSGQFGHEAVTASKKWLTIMLLTMVLRWGKRRAGWDKASRRE
ncbi:hypothetical protein HRG_000033 [Hirsutella rhossiliensis]|uniref:Uncharacterized protein n=1 Tax=Hirsutella rhossiliensis TaxID=111463 RepID=A0A9P8N7H8_9HYPO|nr:uncharacterized protein HRG_00033 [Hirsutella rhossiliensis]KAH0967391.1 hypothetical protein HRG_00033 [Hirsutella rhossiliensis]